MIRVLGDRYEVRQQLSRKAGRQTLLAFDRETGEQVVVKILKFDAEFEWEALKLFERETQILQTLQHPNIPNYLNSFELDEENSKGLALVQTYIEAPSLESHLKSGRKFSEIEIKQIAESLLETLTYLHGHNPSIIHRDIKPSNVLLTNRSGNFVGQVYLVDFGSVQTVASQNSGTFTVVGTYGYMPPEQFSGKTTPVSDLYSLGATLIYLVTGKHPADLMTDDLKLEFGLSTTLSPKLTRWLQQMVQLTPSKRFANASAALQELKNPQFQDSGLPEAKLFGSKITIEEHHNQLCIQFPYPYLVLLDWLDPFLNISAVVIMLVPFVMIFTASPWHIVSLIMSAFLRSLIPKICSSILFSKILIDDEKISFQLLLMSFKLKTWSYRRENIYQLESGNGISVLNIGRKSYVIKPLNELENSWLAQELSRYLNLPLTLFTPDPTTVDEMSSKKRNLHRQVLEPPRKSLRIAPKPSYSKVKVTNTKQVLEIILPPPGFNFFVMIFSLLAWVITGGVTVLILFTMLPLIGEALISGGSFNFIVALFCYGSIFILAFLILSLELYHWILVPLFGVERLKINHSEITLSKEMSGLVRLPIPTADRSHITTVEITPISSTGNHEGQITILPQINIWAGTQKFELGGEGRLTAQELEWLAQNLSLWLDMPITRKS